MQSITTKFFGPTNHRDGRIKARCEAGSITVNYSEVDSLPGYDHLDGAHRFVAEQLIKQLEWDDREWVEAHLPQSNPEYMVFSPIHRSNSPHVYGSVFEVTK